MDKLITTNLGGFPFVLDDIRQFLGRLTSPASQGIYQAFNNLLRGFGDNFIVQGVVASGTTPNVEITEGWVLLDGELIKVDAQTGINTVTDNKFFKETTFNSRGRKTFLNGSINETYEINRAVVQGTSGNLDFDGDTLQNIIGLTVWTTEDVVAGDYTASTGTWTTSGSELLRSIIKGKTMVVTIRTSATILSGGPSASVSIKIPQGKTVSNFATNSILINDLGSSVPGIVTLGIGSNTLVMSKLDGSTIANGPIIILGQITFEID